MSLKYKLDSLSLQNHSTIPTTSFPGSLLFPPPGAREGREEERPWERGCHPKSSHGMFYLYTTENVTLLMCKRSWNVQSTGLSAPLLVIMKFSRYAVCPRVAATACTFPVWRLCGLSILYQDY